MKNLVIDYVVYQVPDEIHEELNSLNKKLNDREISAEQWQQISDIILGKFDLIRENCNQILEVDAIYHKVFYE